MHENQDGYWVHIQCLATTSKSNCVYASHAHIHARVSSRILYKPISVQNLSKNGPKGGSGSTLHMGVKIRSRRYNFCWFKPPTIIKIERLNRITAWIVPKEVKPLINIWDWYTGLFPLNPFANSNPAFSSPKKRKCDEKWMRLNCSYHLRVNENETERA